MVRDTSTGSEYPLRIDEFIRVGFIETGIYLFAKLCGSGTIEFHIFLIDTDYIFEQDE
jgi:hypothetical protein